MAREGAWDVEVQLITGHSRIRLDNVRPADTTVGDLKRMIFEREELQSDTFQLWPGRPRHAEREEQQQPGAPKARRLDDLCTLDHYASLLLLDEKEETGEAAIAPASRCGRPTARVLLQWLPRCDYFRLPPDSDDRDKQPPLSKAGRTRARREIELLLGERQWPQQASHKFVVPLEGVHLWEMDAITMARYVFLVEAPDSSLYQGGTFAVRVTLPSGYPFQKPYMQVLTPIHHPLVSPGGRLALHYAKEGEEARLFGDDWAPYMLMVHMLQMFRQQLLITDYAHLHTTCVPIASLQRALGRWAADGAGQACKARAMTALFAMGDTERAKRQFAAAHPQCRREVETLMVLASRAPNNNDELQSAQEFTTLSDLPCEVVAMIGRWLLLAHMAEARAASVALARAQDAVGQFELPWDWPTKKIIATPSLEDNG